MRWSRNQARIDELEAELATARSDREAVVQDAMQMRAYIDQLKVGYSRSTIGQPSLTPFVRQAKVAELENRGKGATFAKFVDLKANNEALADKVSKLKAKVSMSDMKRKRRVGAAHHIAHAASAVAAFQSAGSGRMFGSGGAAASASAGGAGFAAAMAGRRRGSGGSGPQQPQQHQQHQPHQQLQQRGSAVALLAPGGVRAMRRDNGY